jgi:zinc protease
MSGPKITDLKPGQWAQEISDVAPDPSWRFGVLPNGMRYAIRKNATPPGQASVRLWFDAGSMMEADDQQGLAHFLEHMAFNGSKNVPEGEMVKILERHGLAFGADTNAQTSFDETAYQLDLPKTDDGTVDTSLMLLREAAGELTIAPDAVDRERGVVLSEERTRDTPGYRVAIARPCRPRWKASCRPSASRSARPTF